MKTAQYLDAAKKKLGIESDYALAPHLDLTKQAISKIRNRPLVMSNTTAARIAVILGLDPMKVIADCELERGSNDELWRRIAKRVAVVFFAAGAASGGFNSNGIASPSAPAGQSALSSGPEYTLCNKRRRKRLAGWFTWWALALVSSLAMAGPYAGISLGASRLALPVSLDCPECTHHDVATTAPIVQGFVGYAAGALALELGAGGLSRYRSHNVSSPRIGVGIPIDSFGWDGARDIHQDIDTSMVYARAIVFAPLGERLRLFGSLGAGRVAMHNHEYGWNDPSHQFVEQVNYDVRTRPLVGLGLAYELREDLTARLEASRITNVGVSHWTLHQDVSALALALQYNF